MKRRIVSLLLVLCMLVAMPVVAMADDAEQKAHIRLYNEGDANAFYKTITPGQVVYATNDADGKVGPTTEAAGNWTVKYEYTLDNGIVLTFKGAKIQGDSKGHGMYFGGTDNLTVVVEEDSEVHNGTHTCFWATNKGDLTITGPGKLKLHSVRGNACTLANEGTAYIKDAKLEIISDGQDSSCRAGILKARGSLIIDNSEIALTVPKGNGIWMFEKYKDGSTTEIVSEGHYLISDEILKKDLTIQNGSKITGTTAAWGFGASGDIIVKDSEVEMTCKDNVFAVKPTLELSSGYGAIGGLKASSAKAFDLKKWSQYTYVKIGAGLDAATGSSSSSGSTSSGSTTGGTTSGGTTSTNPATGDNFNVALFSVLALASAATLAAVTVLNKKNAVH